VYEATILSFLGFCQFHRVREAIASKSVRFYHIDGEINPADILSKHWGYAQIWPMLKAILFYLGDTSELITWREYFRQMGSINFYSRVHATEKLWRHEMHVYQCMPSHS